MVNESSLPTQGSRRLSRQEIYSYDVHQTGKNTKQGYILFVEMEYSVYLHDAHSDYPLAPESFEIKLDMLSPCQQKPLKNLEILIKILLKNFSKYVQQERLCFPL